MVVKLEDYRRDARICVRCSGCRFVDLVYIHSHRFAEICPINTRYGFNAYSAHGQLHIAVSLMDGELDYSPGLLDVIYHCTLCGACDVRCKRNLDIEVQLVLEGLRTKAVEKGWGPSEELKAVTQNVLTKGNRYGASPEKRTAWLPKDIVPAQRADILYFVGCRSSYRQPKLAQATARILQAANIPFMLMPEGEQCCGSESLSTGQAELAQEYIERNIKAIEASGASTVITSCATCYQTLKVEYPKLLDKPTEAMGFKVMHISEYMAELVKAGVVRFSKPVKMKVTYHDPCHLARLSEPWIPWHGEVKKPNILEPPKQFRRGTFGVYQPPRELLGSIPGVELVEMPRNKENALCCGAGGGVREAFKDFALWTAGERLEEASSTGAEAIVSCCPNCKENFEEVAKKDGNRVQIYDIVELMAKAIPTKRS